MVLGFLLLRCLVGSLLYRLQVSYGGIVSSLTLSTRLHYSEKLLLPTATEYYSISHTYSATTSKTAIRIKAPQITNELPAYQ
jgi:hypothetical protein